MRRPTSSVSSVTCARWAITRSSSWKWSKPSAAATSSRSRSRPHRGSTGAENVQPARTSTPARLPRSRGELYAWIHEHVELSPTLESALFDAVDAVFTRHQELWEGSKEEAIQALSAGFADKMGRVQIELSAKDAAVSSISRYFEQLVADLTDKSHRDPKTKLINFSRFSEQLEAFLALEQRGHWCAVGLAH